ncbi:hypothetical protein GWK53_30950 [Burkholderia cepacia]|uniref:hypothetical protein n=1 Tax=Burkholderia cepacia TaxID=292 RepID=UPI0013F455C5|nr:hypothetical protein [Burkholderia cepacia]NHB10908.1 hypothetical protein [Burkholderia cepacia]
MKMQLSGPVKWGHIMDAYNIRPACCPSEELYRFAGGVNADCPARWGQNLRSIDAPNSSIQCVPPDAQASVPLNAHTPQTTLQLSRDNSANNRPGESLRDEPTATNLSFTDLSVHSQRSSVATVLKIDAERSSPSALEAIVT